MMIFGPIQGYKGFLELISFLEVLKNPNSCNETQTKKSKLESEVNRGLTRLLGSKVYVVWFICAKDDKMKMVRCKIYFVIEWKDNLLMPKLDSFSSTFRLEGHNG